MLEVLSQRLLPLLQLTRMALVFTAIADILAELLLRAAASAPGRPVLETISLLSVVAVVMTAIGLYGFGMSLNDIIDRRRDRALAAHRPLPSGTIGLVTAHFVCAGFVALALVGAAIYAQGAGSDSAASIALALLTVALITFYDFAGKYLVALGLVSLGCLRFLNAAIAAPSLPVVWHPLLLLNHVTLLSAVGYHWEQKRPALTPKHWGTVLGGLAGIDLSVLALVGWQHGDQTLSGIIPALHIDHRLLAPAVAVVIFIGLAALVRRRNPVARDAGQQLMLYGLLWLIVYDAAFVGAYVGLLSALCLLALLPLAWWSVQLMRWWSKLLSLSHRPPFQRART